MLPQGTPSLDPGGHALDWVLVLIPGGRSPAPQSNSGACAPLANPGFLAWVRLSKGRAPLPSCSLCGGKPGLGHGVDQAPISCPSSPTREGREKASGLGGSCSERWVPAPTHPHAVASPNKGREFSSGETKTDKRPLHGEDSVQRAGLRLERGLGHKAHCPLRFRS